MLGTFTHVGIVEASGSYSQSQRVNLPINLLGNYNLFVVANSPGTVYESNTSNNTSSPVPILLQLTNGQGSGSRQAAVSDLQATSVTGPPTALTGGSVTVSWTVQNNGPGTTNAFFWFDDVWISTNSKLGSGGTDVYLGTVEHINPLSVGSSYSASGTFTLPQNMAGGTWNFIVAVDRPLAPPSDLDSEGVNLVYETNETNNETASATTTAVTVAPLPVLTASNVMVANTAASGQQLAVSWTVTNTGGDTGDVPITDSVYLSYDQILDPSDQYLGSVSYPGGLASGANYTQNASFQLPSGLAGSFYVFVDTNSNNRVYEQNTSGGIADDSRPVQIELAPPADLVAGTVNLQANAVAGQVITITYQVTNNGTNPANGSWYDSLYLSQTRTWSVGDPLLGKVLQTQDLAPGKSYSGTLTATMPGVCRGRISSFSARTFSTPCRSKPSATT